MCPCKTQTACRYGLASCLDLKEQGGPTGCTLGSGPRGESPGGSPEPLGDLDCGDHSTCQAALGLHSH